MTATGQAVGILAEGTDGEAIRRQLEQGNAALYRATCGQSRLVYLPEADAPTAAELERQQVADGVVVINGEDFHKAASPFALEALEAAEAPEASASSLVSKS